MSKPHLPPELILKVHNSWKQHVESIAKVLMRHYPEGSKTCKPEALVEELREVTLQSLIDIAEASYAQGLATAGDARQSIEDLETLRAAARILTRGSR